MPSILSVPKRCKLHVRPHNTAELLLSCSAEGKNPITCVEQLSAAGLDIWIFEHGSLDPSTMTGFRNIKQDDFPLTCPLGMSAHDACAKSDATAKEMHEEVTDILGAA
jgi:hypothetical protein